jgi:hypothetical protein
MAKVQKGAGDAAARLIAKYGKAAVSSAVRNFKPAKAVKITPIKGTGKQKQYPKSNVKPVNKNRNEENPFAKKPTRASMSFYKGDRERMALKYGMEQTKIKSSKKK